MPSIEDLTGQRFGKLTVLGIDEENKYNSSKKILWKCQCDCGTICYKTRDSLKRKSVTAEKACTKACGASIPIGTRFGRLEVIDNIYHKNDETESKCKCDCGNIIIVKSTNLKKGNTTSCGCYKKERMSMIGKQYSKMSDLTGQRFGKLVAIEPTEKRVSKSVVWKCLCDCGNYHEVSAQNLKNGDIVQCKECRTYSRGEDAIKNLLKNENIFFEQQKTFSTCKDNALLRFDFYVNNEYLIEFDGMQHYYAHGWNSSDTLEKIQKRDQIKNDWCKENNIPLIRIPYTKLKTLKIEDLKLKTTKYLIN